MYELPDSPSDIPSWSTRRGRYDLAEVSDVGLPEEFSPGLLFRPKGRYDLAEVTDALFPRKREYLE